jgi:hypothetical protein
MGRHFNILYYENTLEKEIFEDAKQLFEFYIFRKNHGHTFVKSLKWATMVNLPVLMMSFCSIFWLPTIVSNDDLRTTLEENHINKSNYGKRMPHTNH